MAKRLFGDPHHVTIKNDDSHGIPLSLTALVHEDLREPVSTCKGCPHGVT